MALNLVGEHYGRWEVIEGAPPVGNNRRWLCECSCENHTRKIVYQNSLRSGKSTSCGCYNKEVVSKMTKKDLTGKKFGRLLVLEETEKRGPSGDIIWHCICDCGNTVDVRTNALTTGNTKSCGCYNIDATKKRFTKEIESGTVFGKLTVLEKTEERKSGSIIYVCQCSCENKTILKVRADKLRDESCWHCGCEHIGSKGEIVISNILKENNILFEKEKIFSDCRYNKPLRFDFFVNNKYLIEFDGVQHFKADVTGWNTAEKLELTKIRDNIKNQYCKENNISLIRIPYTHIKQIVLEDLLPETSSFLI